MDLNSFVVGAVDIPVRQVKSCIELLEDGATIPFIARYRKEVTGGLDEVEIGAIADAVDSFKVLDKRKVTVLSSIEEQGKLTDQLKSSIEVVTDIKELEDIYLPFKPKRRTRATMARDCGLEPLAKMIMSQGDGDPLQMAKRFVGKGVDSVEKAISGASDIIAEWISENLMVRAIVRDLFFRSADLKGKLIKGKEAGNFRSYVDYKIKVNRIKPHNVHALLRGERESILKVSFDCDLESIYEVLERRVIKGSGASQDWVRIALHDSVKRLIVPSVENEVRSELKLKADVEAISVFAGNLKQLLLESPLGEKAVLAIDPGFRTGCKVVCLDKHGAMVYNDTIFPHKPQSKYKEAIKKLTYLIELYKIEVVAVGNGTAGRETEGLVRKAIVGTDIELFMVNEDGASIYSASKIAREEFPQYDVTVRGAISIGRRLMDPLSELVKIDPKSIGVGQYQHDVDQKLLKQELDRVVESAVNSVGVNLNVASAPLLSYVSGIGPKLAKSIVDYRDTIGEFTERKQLLKVPRLGAKVYEQCAGFLRIVDGPNPLDGTAVHPESYRIVNNIAKSLKLTISKLMGDRSAIDNIGVDSFVDGNVGLETLNDIIDELMQPGRDPRGAVESFEFKATLHTIDDLVVGEKVPGVINNITKFGAFVDIGIKQSGLIHISQLADRFVSDPTDVVSLNQKVLVRVLDVDMEQKRIALSLKDID